MAVLVSAVVQQVAERLGGFQAVTASSGTTTTAIDVALKNYTDDWFAGWWLRGTSGNIDTEENRVSQFLQSTGELTTQAVYTNAVATQTLELHKVLPPSKILTALDHARLKHFPWLSLLLEDATLTTGDVGQSRITIPSAIKRVTDISLEEHVGDGVINNFLANQNGESTDDLTGVQVTLSLFTRKDGYNVVPKYGDACVKTVVTASQAASVTEDDNWTDVDFAGIITTYARWIYCRTAARLTLRLTDGSNTTNSAAHGGAGWELMSVTHTPISGVTALVPSMQITSAAAFEFFIDNGWLYHGDSEPIGRNHLLEHWKVDSRNTRKIEFANRLPLHRQLYIEGEGLLDTPALYATSVNITAEQAHLWALTGAVEALKMFANEISGLSREEQLGMRQDLEAQVSEIRATLGRRPGSLRLVR
jgi:hypothetical protein